jgi:hypothetical protein
MKSFVGITRLFRPGLTSGFAHVPFAVLKGVSSSVRCKSTLDNPHPLSKLESPDTADLSQQNSTANANNAPDIRRGSCAPRWTPDEQRKLKDAVAKGMTAKAIAPLFPSRSTASVYAQCNVLLHNGDQYGKTSERKVQKWSPDELSLLRKLCADGLRPLNVRAHFPHRPIHSIRKAVSVHLVDAKACLKSGTPWSYEDDRRLTELVQTMHRKAIAEALGRTIASIESRTAFLGVKIPRKFTKYTAEEIAIILQMRRDKVPYKHIAENLGPSDHSVKGLRAAYQRHRPLLDSDAKKREIWSSRLSLDELESVSALRAQDVPWPEIGRRYPMHDLSLIVKNYRRATGSHLSATEVRKIEGLRRAGMKWREIFESNRFFYRGLSALQKAYARALEMQRSQQ